MKFIKQIEELLKQSESIDAFFNALKQANIPGWYMKTANDSFKKEHGIGINAIWHRFFIETGSNPVNKFENVPDYTILLVSDNLKEIKVIEKS